MAYRGKGAGNLVKGQKEPTGGLSAHRDCPYKIGDKVTLPPLQVSAFKDCQSRTGTVIEIHKHFATVKCGKYRDSLEY